MAFSGSLVARRHLGRCLRQERERAGLTIRSVRDAKLFSESKVARIEAGSIPVRIGDVWMLCRFYETSPPMMDELTGLAADTSTYGAEDALAVAQSGRLHLYRRLEEICAVLSAYHPELIHGALQTEDYARAVIQSEGLVDEGTVDARLTLQREHTRLVLERSNRSLRVVLGAGAVSLVVGSPTVMSQQASHLRSLVSRGTAEIRVLPWSVGAHPGIRGPFTVLDFDGADDPSVVCFETLLGAGHLEQEAQVAPFRCAFDQLLQRSIPIADYLR
jgi:transcriptional regulator with XRE-family HTH domain